MHHGSYVTFYFCADRPRRLLIFLNPFGGKKLAKKIFQERVAPLLVAAGIDYTLKGFHSKESRVRSRFL
jgi:diacylglycerol kinase family enzyme